MMFVIVKRKNKKWQYVRNFITFNKRWNYLAFAAAFQDQVRVFKTKDEAITFIDKKYIKYSEHVKFWQVHKYEKHFKTHQKEQGE